MTYKVHGSVLWGIRGMFDRTVFKTQPFWNPFSRTLNITTMLITDLVTNAVADSLIKSKLPIDIGTPGLTSKFKYGLKICLTFCIVLEF